MFSSATYERWFFSLCIMLFAIIAMIGQAHAAVDEAVTAAITGAATDVATVGAAVILVFLGIKVVKWIIRAL